MVTNKILINMSSSDKLLHILVYIHMSMCFHTYIHIIVIKLYSLFKDSSLKS